MKFSIKRALSSGAAAACLLAATSGTHAAVYRITALGDLVGGSVSSRAYDINNAGQVVGWGTVVSGASGERAFIWDAAGGIRALSGVSGTVSHAYSINEAGQITGDHRVGGTSASYARAFRWDNGNVQNFGNIGGGWSESSRGQGINESGQVAGSSGSGGVVWGTGTTRKVLPAAAQGWDINDNGLAVGQTGSLAFTFDGTTMRDLGVLTTGGRGRMDASAAYAVNNNGWVVGQSRLAAQQVGEAFAWDGTKMIGLGDLGDPAGGNYWFSSAQDINNSNQVVGWGTIDTTSETSTTAYTGHRAFVWDAGNGMVDLNTLIDPADPLSESGFRLYEAQGINDLGQIVGFGRIGGVDQAFLLTPVPEPHQYGMMLAGLGMVGWMVRRRRSAGGSFGALAA